MVRAFLGAVVFLAIPAMLNTATIEFSHIPAWMSHENLTGVVHDVAPTDHAVAVYICVGGSWWTKPTFGQPLTPLEPDSSWSCDVTTGGADTLATQYAAFLVPAAWQAYLADGVTVLPDSLYAYPHARTIRHPGARTIEFSGYNWVVKRFDGPWGPGPNYFSDGEEDVWVDPEGALHLRIASRDGWWYCSEVILDDSLGYGQYSCAIQSSVESLDPNAVLGLFTWDEAAPQAAYREIDIEFSRWGEIENDNAQYAVQPSESPGNLHRFSLAGGDPTLHRFRWCWDRVEFESLSGNQLLQSWVYLGPDNPSPGTENLRLNFWLYQGIPPVNGQDAEIVVTRFEYRPVNDSCQVMTCVHDTLDVPERPHD